MGLLSRALVPVSYVLSAPVYFGYEGVVRALNVGRPRRELPADALELLQPFAFDDLDLRDVRIVAPAVMPTAQRRARGLTLGDTIFLRVRLDTTDESVMNLVLHETVHVAQARRLGRVGMAHGYGVEWARAGSYRSHPYEVEAYAHQRATATALGEAVRVRRARGADD